MAYESCSMTDDWQMDEGLGSTLADEVVPNGDGVAAGTDELPEVSPVPAVDDAGLVVWPLLPGDDIRSTMQ